MERHEQWELISAFVDGELSAAEQADVASHLATCASCRGELESLREAKRVAAASPRRAMPAALLSEVEARLPKARRFHWLAWRAPNLGLVPAGAVACAIVAVGVWASLRLTGEAEPMPLQPLLAAHSRYTAEGLVPQDYLAQSDFMAELATYVE